MKTKSFLLATAGSTVDGRVIDENMLQEMAEDYDPKSYTARLNIEHIRGVTPDKPFNSYGDVLELSTAEVEVKIGGKTQKRLGLYGIFDVLDNAKEINAKSQKVFPSIEIQPNFAGGGRAYLMGCALTDSPAAIGTERLQFNRAAPGMLQVHAEDSGIEASPLEFVEETTEAAGDKFLDRLGGLLEGFASKLTPKKDEPKPKDEPAKPAEFDMSALTGLFKDFGTEMQSFVSAEVGKVAASVSGVETKFAALEAKVDGTADPSHQKRPASNGSGNFTKTDC